MADGTGETKASHGSCLEIMVFRKACEMEGETEMKVYSDRPKKISERRKKQWLRLKKAREEGKMGFF